MATVKRFAQSVVLGAFLLAGSVVIPATAFADPGDPIEDQHILDSLGLLPSGIFGTEPTLQDLLDQYVPGATIDSALAQEVFCNPELGWWEVELLAEHSGLSETNAFGYYPGGDPSTMVEVFDGPAGPGASATFSDPAFNPLGYYFDRDPAISWFTELALNLDARQHALVFGTPDPHTFFIFWEDLIKLGDRDYNDLVVRARRVIDPPVITLPEDHSVYLCDLEHVCFDLTAIAPGCIDDEITVELIEGIGGFAPITGTSPIQATHCFQSGGTVRFVFRVTDSRGYFSEDTLEIEVNISDPPQCNVPNDTTIFLCSPTEICLPVSCLDPDSISNSMPRILFGPGAIVGRNWCYVPTQSEVVIVSIECTDDCGLSCTDGFTVDIHLDEEPPTVTCPPNFTVPNDPGECGAIVTFQATVDDNCPGETVTCEPPSGSFFQVGTTTVFCTGTDASGNTATCSFEVTVEDIEPPVIENCPSHIILSNDPGQCGAEFLLTAVSARDNCPGVTLTFDEFIFLPVGDSTLQVTATDAAGNTDVCEYTVTVEDNEAPAITCPVDVTVPNDPGECGAILTDHVTYSDNCPGATAAYDPPLGTLLPVGTTPVTVTVTDASGNVSTCQFPLIVQDTEAPVLLPPPPYFEFETEPGVCGATVNITLHADDNCPGATVVCDIDGQFVGTGEHTATCYAVDAAGNRSADVSVLVRVVDTEAPTVTCPQAVTVDNDPGECGAILNLTLSYDDNCPGATIAFNPVLGTMMPIGTSTIMVTVTDAAGNQASCEFPFTVNDVEPPAFVNIPPPLTVPNDPGQCGALVDLPTLTATDNCPGVTVDPPGGSRFFPVGTTAIMYVATDQAGNAVESEYHVTVEDVEPPVPTCPGDITAANDPGQCGAVVTYQSTVNDNCPGATIDCQPPSGSFFPVGVTTVTCTATDAVGNAATCSFTVTVEDTVPPTVQCPNDTSVVAPTDECGAIVVFEATAADACTDPVVTCDPPSGSMFPIGVTVVTCTATDGVNEAVCQFTVTVMDLQPPDVTCPADTTIELAHGEQSAIVDFVVEADDNCPGVTYDAVPPSGSVFPIGETVVTATATDASGNTATCTFLVTILPPPCVQIELCRNYTLFSFNVVPADSALTSLLAPIDGLYSQVIGSYCGTGAATWDSSRPAFLNDLQYLDYRHGYWLIGSDLAHGALEICAGAGTALPVDAPLDLCESWNLISYLPGEADVLPHAWNSIDGLYERAFGVDCEFGIQTWSADRPDFLNDLACLRPTHGYWVKMTAPGTLTYPIDGYNCPVSNDPARISYAILDNVATTRYFADVWSMVSSDVSGLAEGEVLSVYDPDGVLCGETFVLPDGAFLVHVTGDDPETDQDEGAVEGDRLRFVTAGSEFTAAQPVVWANRESFEAALAPSLVKTTPTGFSLLQNYPNPFNAGTVIRFVVEERTGWTVTIYNVVGQRVRTFEGRAESGLVDVAWDATAEDGRRVASGIYFYSVAAGEKSASRKMTLLR